MARISDAVIERKCVTLRNVLLEHQWAPERVEAEISRFRTAEEANHCAVCGTFLVDRADGTKALCVHCTAPRRPWPKSRQGYRPTR